MKYLGADTGLRCHNKARDDRIKEKYRNRRSLQEWRSQVAIKCFGHEGGEIYRCEMERDEEKG